MALNISSPSMSQTAETSAAQEKAAAQRREQSASAEDTRRFEEALQGKDKEGRSGKASSQGGSSSELSDLFSSLLSGMGGNAGNAGQQSAAVMAGQEAVSSALPSDLQQLTDELVDKILVSDPKYTAGSEVRLTLGQGSGSLNGTEIVLRRDLEGMLTVEIACRNQEQFKKFVAVRNDLVQALQQHETQEVRLYLADPADSDPSAAQDFAAAMTSPYHRQEL